MPDIKNNFLQSKMNKDQDARLVPNGQYRDARNVNISKSEGPDVGAIENIIGNLKITGFSLESSRSEVIGSFYDNTNERIYAFVTNYTDSSINRLSNNCATFPAFSLSSGTGVCCAVIHYDLKTNNSDILVFGPWLNFSKTHPVLGINLIENQLFWTDNRNQPRKINVDSAIDDPYDLNVGSYVSNSSPFYQNEDQVSVAKYYPYKPISLVIPGGLTSVEKTSLGNFTVADIYDVTSGGGAGGKVQVSSATGEMIIIEAGSGYQETFTQDINGVVFIFTALGVSSMKDVVSEDLPVTETRTVVPGLYTPGTTISFAAAQSNLNDNFVGSTVVAVDVVGFASDVPANTIVLEVVNNGQGVVLSKEVDLQGTGTGLKFGANPDYQIDYQGDEDVLKEKFVKFSYRFKFKDNEYSLLAPFTQPCFIPKKWGYYQGKDFINTYTSTIEVIMENLVNAIDFQLIAPDKIDETPMTWGEAVDLMHIDSIDLVWKSADSLALKVIDTIPIADLAKKLDSVYSYSYVSKKPIRTLPESELTRTSDKVPVRALAQESVGNRIVYANFTANLGRPESLDYSVQVDEKFRDNNSSVLEIVTPPNLLRSYPAATVKQNRTYQVGVVLVDRYGRQSDTILSTNDLLSNEEGFQGSTYYHPYRNEGQPLREDIDNIWEGDSIKVLFTNPIPSSVNIREYAGLYASDQSNPTGWATYKIVVKQQEQEYYNVYLPGILNNYGQRFIDSAPVTSENVANMVLIGDNINKVPRELQDVGPTQKEFSADVDFWCRVDSSIYGASVQYHPFKSPDTIRIIGGFSDLNYDRTNPGVDGGDTAGTDWTDAAYKPVSPFFNIPGNLAAGVNDQIPFEDVNNTLIAKASTSKKIGILGGGGYTSTSAPWAGNVGLDGTLWYKQPPLSVIETRPVSSNLDIFWDTSTSGTINALNPAILQGDTTTPVDLQPLFFNYDEAMPPLSLVSNAFYPLGNGAVILNNANTDVILTLTRDGNNNVVDLFEVEKQLNNSFILKLKSGKYNYFGANSPVVNNYTFTFLCSNLDVNGNQVFNTIVVAPPNLLDNITPGWFDNGGSFDPPTTGGPNYGYPGNGAPFSPGNISSPNTFDVINQRALEEGTYQDAIPSNPTASFIGNGWNSLVALNGFNGSLADGSNGIPFLIKNELSWVIKDCEFWWTGRLASNGLSEPAWQSLCGMQQAMYNGNSKNQLSTAQSGQPANMPSNGADEVPQNWPNQATGSLLIAGTGTFYVGKTSPNNNTLLTVSTKTVGTSAIQQYPNVSETILHRLRALAHWYSNINNVVAPYAAALNMTGVTQADTLNPIWAFTANNSQGKYYMPQYHAVYDYANNTGGGNFPYNFYPSVKQNVVATGWVNGNRAYLGNVTPGPQLPNQPPTGRNDTLYRVKLEATDAGNTSVSFTNTLYLYFIVSGKFISSENLSA